MWPPQKNNSRIIALHCVWRQAACTSHASQRSQAKSNDADAKDDNQSSQLRGHLRLLQEEPIIEEEEAQTSQSWPWNMMQNIAMINKQVGNVAFILYSVTRSEPIFWLRTTRSLASLDWLWLSFYGFGSQPMSNTWILLNLPMLIIKQEIINAMPHSPAVWGPLLMPGTIEHPTDMQQSSWAKHVKWTLLFSLALQLSHVHLKKLQEINGYHINLLSRIRNLLQKTSSMIHDCRMLLNLEPALSQANFDPLDASHPDDHDVWCLESH